MVIFSTLACNSKKVLPIVGVLRLPPTNLEETKAEGHKGQYSESRMRRQEEES